LIKSTNKGKKTIPKNFVRDIFEVYSINECGKEFLKIALPYSEINHFNRHDYYLLMNSCCKIAN